MDKTRKQFIVVTTTSSCDKNIVADLLSDPRTEVYNGVYPSTESTLKKFVRTVHFSTKINKIVDLPFKSAWKNCLDNVKWQKNVTYYVIFMAPVFLQISIKKLKELKEKYNIKYICYHIDCLRNGIAYEKMKKYKDQVGLDYEFTFDPQDSKDYGMMYWELCYSKYTGLPTASIDNDIYLIANAKGRLNEFHAIYDYLLKHGLNARFEIAGVREKQQKYPDIIYNKKISYRETLNKINMSNCILEVLCDGQSGNTIRYNEAICYNKKLLTNNKNVVNLPFYNPTFIHIFEKPEDIDWEWVKERIPVDYHYDGRFSPVHLINRIIELEEQKEAQVGGEEK